MTVEVPAKLTKAKPAQFQYAPRKAEIAHAVQIALPMTTKAVAVATISRRDISDTGLPEPTGIVYPQCITEFPISGRAGAAPALE